MNSGGEGPLLKGYRFKEAPTVYYLRRIAWLLFFTLLGVFASMGMLIALLAGGSQSMGTMNVMKEGMAQMNARLTQTQEAATMAVNRLVGQFPANQLDVTTRQVLKIIENVEQISARTQFITQRIEPDSIGKTVTDVHGLLSALPAEDIQRIKDDIIKMMGDVTRVLDQVNPADIQKLLQGLGNIDTNEMNTLIGNMAKLKEINVKVNI